MMLSNVVGPNLYTLNVVHVNMYNMWLWRWKRAYICKVWTSYTVAFDQMHCPKWLNSLPIKSIKCPARSRR